jgi:sialidase-1
MKTVLMMLAMLGVSWSASTVRAGDFDRLPKGSVEAFSDDLGSWSAEAGHMEIHTGNARSGTQSLRLLGGEQERVMELRLAAPLTAPSRLAFWAERWTARDPFSFRVSWRKAAGEWTDLWDGAAVKIGGFNTECRANLPAGAEALRFTATSVAGVLIDDLVIAPLQPMQVTSVETVQPVIPALIRKKDNPVVGLVVHATGALQPRSVTGIEVSLEGTTRLSDIRAVRIAGAGADGDAPAYRTVLENFGEAAASRPAISGRRELLEGSNHFWVMVELNESADLDHRVDAGIVSVTLDDGTVLKPAVVSPPGAQRIGVAVRLRGDDGVSDYRIPGLATTKSGTLIGVYDIRWRNGGDLPGDIDVGMSRSTDGGRTWEPMRVIMDMGRDPKWAYDGVGDPAVLVDEVTGRIWVTAVWSHGRRAWHGSGKGLTPEETGQFMLAHSDDDGKTWSAPVNITEQVKDPDWHYLLQGPGRGITMKDGTLVFAAQFQAGDTHANGRKIGTPHSTILWSADQGQTWKVGTGVKPKTTEAQVVQLGDGSLMINCRDDRGGSRTVATTRDMGKTWTPHPTDRSALPEPVCMASLLRLETRGHGPLLLFSNPATKSGRTHMTVKVSRDEGMTWPEAMHTLYDTRRCSGYSCLTPVGDDRVGVLYEGANEMFFLRFPLSELVRD